MKFLKFKTEALASAHARNLILKHIKSSNHLNLGLATGSTPATLYKQLVEDHKVNKTSWAHVKCFHLDEFLDIDLNSEISHHKFMADHLHNHTNIKHENIFFPQVGQDYDKLIVQHNKIDLQILGIGGNGHLGFNEPGSKPNGLTQVVDLVSATINDCAKKYYNGDVEATPNKAIAMGLGSIMHAKEIILLAFGASKTETILKLQNSKHFDPSFPASILSTHPNVTVIVDEEVQIDL